MKLEPMSRVEFVDTISFRFIPESQCLGVDAEARRRSRCLLKFDRRMHGRLSLQRKDTKGSFQCFHAYVSNYDTIFKTKLRTIVAQATAAAMRANPSPSINPMLAQRLLLHCQ
jgi:hypothetical protein